MMFPRWTQNWSVYGLIAFGFLQLGVLPTNSQFEKLPEVSQPTASEISSHNERFEVDCNRPPDLDSAELCEQRRSANAAEAAVWWTAVQTQVSIIGFSSVIVSLVLSGLATRSAARAANAAEVQTELSRQALVSTERAFVFCERIDANWIARKEDEVILKWCFTPKLRNSGKTPAINCLSAINTWIGINSGALPDDFEFPDYAEAARTIIGPGAEMHSQDFYIDVEVLDKIRTGSAHAYFWGWFEYNDVFSGTARHRSEFCFEVMVVGNPIYKTGGFRYRLFGPFNGFDEECFRKAKD